ncbi:MAG: LPS export ABC transporter periplasmic protein LptC [Rhodospirillales bacterium]|nr:LPS export ABC transporter periplasmic protein LptC [Rhodospirillales bacterium]
MATATPPPVHPPEMTPRARRQALAQGMMRQRRLPTTSGLARRHLVISIFKWALPVLALLLLGTIALWPEFDHVEDITTRNVRAMSQVDGARLVAARYHGVDQHGQPYTLTAATAVQDGPDLVHLTQPRGDITLTGGTWLMIKAVRGTYRMQAQSLDLDGDVRVYRDDGTTLRTAAASLDLKQGAGAGSDPVHAEGPFGVLDAAGGFTITDKGANVHFAGPIHLILNGEQP